LVLALLFRLARMVRVMLLLLVRLLSLPTAFDFRRQDAAEVAAVAVAVIGIPEASKGFEIPSRSRKSSKQANPRTASSGDIPSRQFFGAG